MKCIACGNEIVRGAAFWREVTGWVQNRVGGGVNHVALRKNTGRVVCESCMNLRKSGISVKQQTLGETS